MDRILLSFATLAIGLMSALVPLQTAAQTQQNCRIECDVSTNSIVNLIPQLDLIPRVTIPHRNTSKKIEDLSKDIQSETQKIIISSDRDRDLLYQEPNLGQNVSYFFGRLLEVGIVIVDAISSDIDISSGIE